MPQNLPAKCNLTTLVDLSDVERLRRDFRNWLVIVHFNPLRQSFPSMFDADYPDFQLAKPVARLLEQVFGQPVRHDRHLAAWLIY